MPPKKTSAKSDSLAMDTGELKKTISRLMLLTEMSRDMNLSLESKRCFKEMIDKVSKFLAVEVISLMMLDEKKGELTIEMAKGVKEEVVREARAKLGEGIAGRVARDIKPILIEDFGQFPNFKTSNGRKYKTDSCMSVPLAIGGQVLGVLNVTDKTDGTSFTKDDLETLTSIANHVAGTIRNSRVYEELKRINDIRSDFLAVLSHELKNPLNNIKASLDTFLDETGKDLKTEHVRFLTLAKDNIDRLNRLVHDLLEVSKFEAGKLELARDSVDVTGLVGDVSDQMRNLFEKKEIDFTVSLPQNNIAIWGDSDRLEQVLINLLNNALKFTSRGGKVSVSLEDAGEDIRLAVSDTGIGIAKADLEKIFDKFSNISIKTDGIVQGTGLGLCISKDIVGMHKGSIRAESEERKGSRFFVELPKDLRKKEAAERLIKRP